MSGKEEIITQSEFAKRVGVSETSIRKAIKKGRIDAGFFRNPDNKPRIRYLIALAEWTESSSIAPKPKLPDGQHTPNGVIETGNESGPPEMPKEGSMPELNRKHKRLQITSTAFDLAIKQGKYVEKEKVYRVLFTVAQEVRQAIEAIPDRVIDEMMASKDRNRAHTILTKEINRELTRLSEAGDTFDKLNDA